jgi:hypothetical protein
MRNDRWVTPVAPTAFGGVRARPAPGSRRALMSANVVDSSRLLDDFDSETRRERSCHRLCDDNQRCPNEDGGADITVRFREPWFTTGCFARAICGRFVYRLFGSRRFNLTNLTSAVRQEGARRILNPATQ